MKPLSVTIIQSDLHWENPKANRLNFSNKIQSITENTDLVILPEMFTTGFSMHAESLAEAPHGGGSEESTGRGKARERDDGH